MELTEEKREEVLQESIPPMGFRMIAREFVKEKMAMFSLILLVIILLAVFIGSLVLDQSAVMHVSILDKYAEPGTVTMNGTKFILGADEGGRDVLGQLIIGARNSILIGFAITIITSIIGVGLGIISGYYGGMIDNILMRIVDFIMILPIMLIIIVFVSVIPKYSIWSLIITNLTINFAANIGIETTLTFLGFGLPQSVPSLGTLIGYASSGNVLVNKQWVWLPASILILVLMLSINYVGQAFKRSADARQRLG
ncbi:ABC transporter permease [Enterococcus faecalis]|uniref:ABC transporter permease n=1 Tax=Enterococcus faecalis TaxID=1351 RepID=UPI00115719CE|nr:ABC transporter permease subunit [Enterococcus faecalis]